MPAKKLLIASGLVIAATAAGLGFHWPFNKGPAELRLPGIVEVQEVRLSSRVGGRVKSIAVKEGDLVKAGQPLVTFDLPELEAQREQALRRRQAMEAMLERARNGATPEARAAAEASVASAEAHRDRVKAAYRPEEIDQAQQEWNAIAAEVEYARVEWERERWMQTKNLSTDSKLDSARAAFQRSKAQADAAAARLKLFKAGPKKEDILEAEAEVRRTLAQRDLTVAPTRSEEISEWVAKVAELTARIRELDAMLAEGVVSAPEPAIVEVLAVRPGDVTGPNQPVARLLRADDLWVKAYVPATQLGNIRLNQTVEVTIDSHPGRRFNGTIAQIATAGEFTPRNVQTVDERANQVFAIKVRVPDPEGIFKSGMAADVFVRPGGQP